MKHLITGAGTGIGRALAENCLQRGHHVIAVGRREAPLQSLANTAPQQVSVCVADVGTVAGRNKIIDAVKGETLYSLVHNAGIVTPLGPLLDVELVDFESIMRINVTAPLMLTQALWPQLNGGRILHISSGAAHMSSPGIPAYCISKAALYSSYLTLKNECGDKGIAVGSVKPGIVETPIQETLRGGFQSGIQSLGYFQEVYDGERFVPMETSGQFLSWLICDTDAARFSAEEWDVYDTSHHAEWIKDVKVPVNHQAT